MAFSRPVGDKLVHVNLHADTLPQVQLTSKRILKKKEWKQFKAQHYIQVVDSQVAINKQFIHWYKNNSESKRVIKESLYTKQVIHSWGTLEKVDKQWELTQWFVAPTNMHLQIEDTTDFNGDGQPEMVLFWYQSYSYNHEFGTGKNEKTGIYIWDVAKAKNLLSLMLTAKGGGWNMCSGKSSSYSNKYYDLTVKGKTLEVNDYTQSPKPKRKVFVFEQNCFRIKN